MPRQTPTFIVLFGLLLVAVMSWMTAGDFAWAAQVQLMLSGRPFAILISPTAQNIPVAGVMIWKCVQSGSQVIGYVDMGADVHFIHGRQPAFDSMHVMIGSMYSFLASAIFTIVLIVALVINKATIRNTRGFPVVPQHSQA